MLRRVDARGDDFNAAERSLVDRGVLPFVKGEGDWMDRWGVRRGYRNIELFIGINAGTALQLNC